MTPQSATTPQEKRKRVPKPRNFIPEPYFPEGHRLAGNPRCLGWSNNRGRQCKNSPIKQKTKCRVHGGKSLAGMAAPAWQTGKFSKYLPTRLLARYQDALNDTELLALRDEIALLDARLAELIGRIDTDESSASFRKLQSLYLKFEKAMRGEDDVKKNSTLRELRGAIWDGAADYGTWRDIQGIIENRRRVVESERKRLVEMQQMVTSEQAMLLIGALSSVIREYVKDRDALNAISNEFIRIAGLQPRRSDIA